MDQFQKVEARKGFPDGAEKREPTRKGLLLRP